MAVNNTGHGKSHWRKSFNLGLHNQTPLILCAAGFLLIVLLLVLNQQYISPTGIWSEIPLKYWMRDASDNQIEVSWNVAHLKRLPPKRPLVVLLGGSVARLSVSIGSDFVSAVALHGGPQIEALNLASSSQNFAESWAIIDNLPDTPTTALIGVSLNRFAHTQEENFQQMGGYNLLIASAATHHYFSTTFGKMRPLFGLLPGIFKYIITFPCRRLLESFFNLHLRLNNNGHLRNNDFATREKIKRYDVQKWLQTRTPQFNDNFAFNALLLDQMVKHGIDRGINIVLLELPCNSDLIGNAFDADFARMRRLCQDIAATYRIPYININDQFSLPNTAFQDIVHMDKDSGVIFESTLAENLAAMYRSGAIEKQ